MNKTNNLTAFAMRHWRENTFKLQEYQRRLMAAVLDAAVERVVLLPPQRPVPVDDYSDEITPEQRRQIREIVARGNVE